mmetsp:Transcript_12526/g.45675  ORF Transcript_12526/g.45675 Transcript_12526/m.45675 type:complete len:557 (-) Transcript_12526:438-2108(-)
MSLAWGAQVAPLCTSLATACKCRRPRRERGTVQYCASRRASSIRLSSSTAQVLRSGLHLPTDTRQGSPWQSIRPAGRVHVVCASSDSAADTRPQRARRNMHFFAMLLALIVRLLYSMVTSGLRGLLNAIDVALCGVAWPLDTIKRVKRGASKKRVVIVGASFGGLTVLQELKKTYDVTLIDSKNFFEYTPGVLRVLVDLGHLARVTAKLPSRHNALIVGTVTDVASDHVVVRQGPNQNGEVLNVPFDYLCIATGSTYPGHIKPSVERTLEERTTTWSAEYERLLGADSVLIVGAGAVGVELAGEIATTYPEKSITVVDRNSHVLANGFPKSSQDYCEKWLRTHGVDLRLNTPITNVHDEGCDLQDGSKITAQVVYRCMGAKPATDCLGSSIGGIIDARGALRVNDYLQVVGYRNVFAVGDVIAHSSNEWKLGHTAEMNGRLAALNLSRLDEQKELMKYPDGIVGGPLTPKVYCVSLGKYDASLGFNKMVVNGALPALMKWLLEWTQVQKAQERHIGILFWHVADHVANFLGRTVLLPKDKAAQSGPLNAGASSMSA